MFQAGEVTQPLISALRRQRQEDLWIWSQPDLQNKIQDKQSYTERSYVLNPTPNKKKEKKVVYILDISLLLDTWVTLFYPIMYMIFLLMLPFMEHAFNFGDT